MPFKKVILLYFIQTFKLTLQEFFFVKQYWPWNHLQKGNNTESNIESSTKSYINNEFTNKLFQKFFHFGFLKTNRNQKTTKEEKYVSVLKKYILKKWELFCKREILRKKVEKVKNEVENFFKFCTSPFLFSFSSSSLLSS